MGLYDVSKKQYVSAGCKEQLTMFFLENLSVGRSEIQLGHIEIWLNEFNNALVHCVQLLYS